MFTVVGRVTDFAPAVQGPRVGVSRHEVTIEGDAVSVRLSD